MYYSGINEIHSISKELPSLAALSLTKLSSTVFKNVETVYRFLAEFINIPESKKSMELMFNNGVVSELDQLIESKAEIMAKVDELNESIRQIASNIDPEFVFIQEVGFLVSFNIDEEITDKKVIKFMENNFNQAKLVCHNGATLFFRSAELDTLNSMFGDPWREMVEIKRMIETVLVNKVTEVIPELNIIADACAQLEVFLAFSKISNHYNLIRPKVIF